jgi:RHS repeat-associated protein
MPQQVVGKNGGKVWEGEYFAFGGVKVETGSLEQRLRFAGQYYDQETGNYYNYFRDYDPSTGRYLQSDPIGLRGGLNTYGYVGGNPLFLVDFFGLAATCTCQSTGPYNVPGKNSFYAINPGTGKEEKYCNYKCSCKCDNGKTLDSFEVQAFTGVTTRGGLECLYQKYTPKDEWGGSTAYWDQFSFTTGLHDPPPGWEDHGYKPYPDYACEKSPELCDHIDKKCDDCDD